MITIFSASNYYEIGSNKGAYLKLNPQLDTHFVQYTAASSKTRKLTFRQRVGLVESSALRELGARLRERRCELEHEFRARDPNNTGKCLSIRWYHSFFFVFYVISFFFCLLVGFAHSSKSNFVDKFALLLICNHQKSDLMKMKQS